MLTLGTLMSLDQALLDGHWDIAGKLTGLAVTRWQCWARPEARDSSRAARSTLADSTWLAAVIGDLKDDDFIRKFRGPPKGKGKGADKVAEARDASVGS